MAAVPSWEPNEPSDAEKQSKGKGKGAYRCGIIIGGSGEVSGEAGLRLMDFSPNPSKRFRGGTDVFSLSAELGRRTQQADVSWERGNVGVSVTHKRTPARQAQPGWPSWQAQKRRSTEGRIFWEPKTSIKEVYCRVKKWDEGDIPVAAVGAKLGFGRKGARMSVLVEGAATTPFVRAEVGGLLRRGVPERGATELRVGVKNVLPLMGTWGAEPPAGELYNFGGADIRGYTETGLLPSAASDTRSTLPATATAAFSLTHLIPFDASLGFLFFLDGGAAAGSGSVAVSNSLPLLDARHTSHTTWATPLFLSYGVGLYLPSAPGIRVGLAWGLDKRIDPKKRQRIFLSAVGEV